MLDIKFLRENPDLVKDNIKKKFQDHKLVLVDEVIEFDSKKREVTLKGDELRASRNSLSSQIGALMKEGKREEAEEIKLQVQKINEELVDNEKLEEQYANEIICFYSDNDPYVKYEVEKDFANKIATEQILIPNAGHINSESGYDTFEDIVNYL